KLIAIPLEDRPRMRRREVFPLQARSGKLLLHCLHEPIYEVEVILTSDPFMTPAEVLRILQPFRIVGSCIQHNGQRPFGTDPSNQRVQRKLSYWDAEATRTLIANAQDALPVGYDDYIYLLARPASQKLGDRVTERIRDKQSTGAPINVAELFTCQSNGWR